MGIRDLFKKKEFLPEVAEEKVEEKVDEIWNMAFPDTKPIKERKTKR